MPESMVSEVFGVNAKYADNSNTTVTPDPDNPEFQFNVTFDSSKIPAVPKRNTSAFAHLAMPSDKFIDLSLTFTPVGSVKETGYWTAPADGIVDCIHSATAINANATINYLNDINSFSANNKSRYGDSIGIQGVHYAEAETSVLVRKGDKVRFAVTGGNYTEVTNIRFYYAQGAI